MRLAVVYTQWVRGPDPVGMLTSRTVVARCRRPSAGARLHAEYVELARSHFMAHALTYEYVNVMEFDVLGRQAGEMLATAVALVGQKGVLVTLERESR